MSGVGSGISPFLSRPLPSGGSPIPPPPYAVFSVDGINVLNSISGLTYQQGSGPSPDSITFSLLGAGLSPAADDITLTLDSDFSTSFEFYNPDTSAWEDASTTIAYTGGAITLAGFLVRLKAGLTMNNYSGTITISAPNTTAFVLTANGNVTLVFDPDAILYFNELTGTLSNTFKVAVNTWFVSEKANGNFSKYDRAGLLGTENQQNATISFVNPTSDPLVEVNSPTWNAGFGYTGNGSTMYLDTEFSPVMDGVNYTLNSASYGVYSRTNIDEFSNDIGSAGVSFSVIYALFGGNFAAYINTGSSDFTLNANADSRGLFVACRTDSVTQKLYKNGVEVVSDNTRASTSIEDIDFYLLARNFGGANNFSTRQLSFYFIASGTLDQAGAYSSIQTLATSLGFNV